MVSTRVPTLTLASCASATTLAATACSFFAIVSGLSIRTSTVPAATSWPRTTGISATRPSTRAAMSSRVASTSPCTSKGWGRTRYQIDKDATAAITRPTIMAGIRVEAGALLFGVSNGCFGSASICSAGVLMSIRAAPFGSLHEPAVADDDRLTGKGVRRKGGQEQRGFGHVIDRGEFTVYGFLQHDGLDDILLGDAECLGLLGDLLVDQRGADEAGTDHIGPNPVRRTLLGHYLCQTDQAVLGGDVRCLEHRAFLGVNGSHIDDAAAILFVHLAQRRAGGQEGAVEMNGQHLFPLREVKFDDGCNDLNARIADEDVQSAESLDHLGGAGFDLSFVGHIHGNADSAVATRIDLSSSLARSLGIEVSDGDMRTFAEENIGNLPADPACSSSDECDLLVETHVDLHFR